MKQKNNESKLQQSCVKWFRLQYPKEVLYAIPNGGKRDVVTASILKAEGTLAGVADLFLMSNFDNPAKGLYIEMKIKGGVQSEYQKQFEIDCINRGYGYAIAKSFEEFVAIVRDFLSEARTGNG